MTTQQRAATRIGIVGLGRAGGIHFDALQAVQNAEVAAVCDVSAESRSRAAVSARARIRKSERGRERSSPDRQSDRQR